MVHYFSPPGDAGLSVAPPSAPPSSDTSSRFDLNTVPRPSLTKKAKVLYDYDAVEKNELSLLADEVSVSKPVSADLQLRVPVKFHVNFWSMFVK